MRVVALSTSLLLAGLTLLLSIPATAHAGPQEICVKATGVCYLVKKLEPTQGGGMSVPRETGAGSPATEQASLGNGKASWSDFVTAAFQSQVCAGAAAATGSTGFCPGPTTGPVDTTVTPGGVPLITPAQAGAIAAARLQIPTVAPGIGPSPDLNRWKMAAVGYPLWLWADGPTQVGPVSDSIAGLSVSLSAEVTSLSFRMGDGATVNCAGVGDQWTKAVEPGAEAPSCGHTYTKPSLPKGRYKVTALTEWAVTWTANGQSGVINVPAVRSTELPVGELQVLVR